MDDNLVGLVLGGMIFLIPILAIVLKSQVGKALALYLESKAKASTHEIENMLKSENLLLGFSERLMTVEQELVNLRESNEKLHQHLLDNNDRKQLPP